MDGGHGFTNDEKQGPSSSGVTHVSTSLRDQQPPPTPPLGRSHALAFKGSSAGRLLTPRRLFESRVVVGEGFFLFGNGKFEVVGGNRLGVLIAGLLPGQWSLVSVVIRFCGGFVGHFRVDGRERGER